MNTNKVTIRVRRQGFTLIEILVVISVILLLLTISVFTLTNALAVSRQRATQATIRKVHGLVQQRVEAFNRALDRLNLAPAVSKMQRDLGISNTTTQVVCQILVRKQIYQSRFPQNFYETNIANSITTYNSAAHNQNTESAALLYWMLTKSEIYGIAPVDESEFGTAEVRDTDGDGLLEFVDGWGHPLRFYRWPTQLFRPGNSSPVAPGIVGSATPITLSPVDTSWANLLWSGLPQPTGNLGTLARDPDDPTGALRRFAVNSPAAMTLLQNRFHTPDTYHAFLIVSAGADNALGLGEPYDYSGSLGAPDVLPLTTLSSSSPALGTSPGQGRLAAVLSYNAQVNPIFDNITNRTR